MRERLSMIFYGVAIMLVIGLFGMLERIVDFIGPIVTNRMMEEVGIMLAKVALDMIKSDRIIGVTSTLSGVLIYFFTHDLVYTVLNSVILSSIARFLIVLGMFVTLSNNATATLAGGENSVVGGMTMAVTALTAPFLGMLVELVTQYFVNFFGM